MREAMSLGQPSRAEMLSIKRTGAIARQRGARRHHAGGGGAGSRGHESASEEFNLRVRRRPRKLILIAVIRAVGPARPRRRRLSSRRAFFPAPTQLPSLRRGPKCSFPPELNTRAFSRGNHLIADCNLPAYSVMGYDSVYRVL